MITLTWMIAVGAVFVSAAATRAGTQMPSTGPADNGWDGRVFAFDRPATLAVEETTPSAEEVSWVGRPAAMPEREPDPVATAKAAPRVEGEMNVVRLRFKDADGEVVPALLCTPREGKGPFPLVVAVHGLTSNKAQVCAQVAPSLTKRGFAVLAADLPRHGERPGNPLSMVDRTDPVQSFTLARRAVNDVRQLIDLAGQRADLETRNGVVLLGYSLGSWVNSVAGPLDSRVKAMVLMVGGASDIPAIALRVPQVAAVDPRRALPHFSGRPVLMLNGREDHVVNAEMGRRLFAAAAEPKKQIWYDCGHLLTPQAYEDAADWVETFRETIKR